jgi:serine protease Do
MIADVRLRLAAIAAIALMPCVATAEQPRVPVNRDQVTLSFAPLIERTAPAVVNIFAQKLVHDPGVPPAFGDAALWRLFSDAFLFGYGARERVKNSLGSGVIVRADGIVVTNHHVIDDAQGIFVSLADDRVFPAEVMTSDKRTDIAVLRIGTLGEALPVLAFGDSDRLKVGDIVVAIGNPFGIGQSVTTGVVSALARTGVGIGDFRFFIQTDAAINPGNSGGALIAVDGSLVGINTAIFTRSGGSQGIGFAVPVNIVRTVVESAVAGRTLVRPWIGVTGVRVPPQLAMVMGLGRPTGVLVTGLHESGPAAAAGIERGDIILAVGDLEIDNVPALRYRIATRMTGEMTRLTLMRAGRRIEVDVLLVGPPEDPPRQEAWLPSLHILSGARVANLSPAFAEELGLDSAIAGVVVLEVRAGSAASRLGLQSGDVIRSFEGSPLRTIGDLRAIATTPFTPRLMLVNRGGRDITIGGG